MSFSNDKTGVAEALKQVQAKTWPEDTATSDPFGWDPVPFKTTVIGILKNRFGGEWDKHKEQWPSYAGAISQFLDDNPFFIFSDWQPARADADNEARNYAGGTIRNHFHNLTKKIINKIKDKEELNNYELNFIRGIASWYDLDTDSLSLATKAFWTDSEGPKTGISRWSVGVFPFNQESKDAGKNPPFTIVGDTPDGYYQQSNKYVQSLDK